LLPRVYLDFTQKPIAMTDINFVQLLREGKLESFILDLQNLTDRQREAIEEYKDRSYLAPLIADLRKETHNWHRLIATAVAFRNRYEILKK